MDIILSKLIVGLLTVILALLGIAVESKKNGKVTPAGKIVFCLLIVLGGFTIYSDLFEEISDRDEKVQRQNKELLASEKREKEYKETVKYLEGLQQKSEKTLTRFDSLAYIQSMILEKSKAINSELAKSKALENEIRMLSKATLDETKKVLLPISDSIEVVGYFSLKNTGFQNQFKKESSIEKSFSVTKSCEVEADTNQYRITNIILSDIIHLTRFPKLNITFYKGQKSAKYEASLSPKKLDLCSKEFGYFINRDRIEFLIPFTLKLKESFFFQSSLDLHNSLAAIEFDSSPAPEYWDRLDYADSIKSLITLTDLIIIFDDRKNIVAEKMKVHQEGKTFYVERVKLIKPE